MRYEDTNRRNTDTAGRKELSQDVYKRQDLYEGYPHLYRKENLSVTMDGGERDIMAYVMTGEREYGVPARSYYAVSYTHLDVYKRQAVHGCPASGTKTGTGWRMER